MANVDWKKFVVVGAVAGSSLAGAEYVQSDNVNVANVIVAVLGALLGFLTNSQKS